MNDLERKRKEQRRQPAVWIGECVCGVIAYEVQDGTTFIYATGRRHTPWDCLERRRNGDVQEAGSHVVAMPDGQTKSL